jgi:hypothetical protein
LLCVIFEKSRRLDPNVCLGLSKWPIKVMNFLLINNVVSDAQCIARMKNGVDFIEESDFEKETRTSRHTLRAMQTQLVASLILLTDKTCCATAH